MAEWPEIRMIDSATLRTLMDTGAVTLFDVREPHEFQAERIPGSHLLPLSVFDPSEIHVDPGSSLVLHCKSGVRCGLAAELMLRAGYHQTILRLAGGIEAWKQQGGSTCPG